MVTFKNALEINNNLIVKVNLNGVLATFSKKASTPKENDQAIKNLLTALRTVDLREAHTLAGFKRVDKRSGNARPLKFDEPKKRRQITITQTGWSWLKLKGGIDWIENESRKGK